MKGQRLEEGKPVSIALMENVMEGTWNKKEGCGGMKTGPRVRMGCCPVPPPSNRPVLPRTPASLPVPSLPDFSPELSNPANLVSCCSLHLECLSSGTKSLIPGQAH